jgi:multidrug efflux pump subunit AcrB
MRVWLDPQRVAAQRPVGGRRGGARSVARTCRSRPASSARRRAWPGVDLQLSVNAQGRLRDRESSARSSSRPGPTRQIALARHRPHRARRADYALRSLLDNKNAVAIPIFQAPGSNAIASRRACARPMDDIRGTCPKAWLRDRLRPDAVRARVDRVGVHTLLEAIALVVLVVILFLQTWRASIIPLLAVPVSVIGTFAVMQLFGFSINALRPCSAWCWPIGIVVDDAIVVVENVERFVPPQDQGYFIIAGQLPDGASLARTDAVVQQITKIALETPGIRSAVAFVGFSGATRTNNTNAAAVFVGLEDARDRAKRGLQADNLLADLRHRLGVIDEGFVFAIPPPPVPGIGSGGGFKMQIQDRGGAGLRALATVVDEVVAKANATPGLVQVFSTFRADSPQLFVDIDRTKATMLGVPISSVFETLQTYLGSTYVNDFNYLGRVYRVMAQADTEYRDDEADIARLRTRNKEGGIVPLGSFVRVETRSAPDRVVRFNLYPSADVNGDTMRGFSTGQSLDTMERLVKDALPEGMAFEWTDLAYQEKAAGNSALFIFPLCVLLVFLSLAAQYESWLLPLAIILIVPLCLLFALAGVWIAGLDNNILVQIGFVVLVGLACKNAILIVEFARAQEEEGKDRFEAAVEACRLRLRPILMTSFAFILGVVPLLIATGAGAEMRRSLGTAVFSGMIGVTLFGLLLTPVFYVVLRGFVARRRARPTEAPLIAQVEGEVKA